MSVSKLSLNPFAKPSAGLAHLNRIMGSQSGQDKLFMAYCYSSHVVMYCLRSKQLATKGRIDIAERMAKLTAVISDARMLYRLFGLFPIIGWSQSLNDPATAPKDKQIALLQRLQAYSMLLYYPLEHTYYLSAKGVFDIAPTKLKSIAMWSARFWAAYVALQFAVIHREHALLASARKTLSLSRNKALHAKTVGTAQNEIATEKAEILRIQKKEQSLRTDLLVQIGYLPLTMHWSLPNGLLPDQVYVGICGTIAAVFGIQGVWRATSA